jgi:adenylate kinase
LEDEGRRLDRVILLDVPDAELMERLTGRRVCVNCAATFHVVSMRPARENVCDICGGALRRREDDGEETVRNRLAVYGRQTAPLIAYYEAASLLTRVDGTVGMEGVTRSIERTLTGRIER